jgi:hypothetical protein
MPKPICFEMTSVTQRAIAADSVLATDCREVGLALDLVRERLDGVGRRVGSLGRCLSTRRDHPEVAEDLRPDIGE